jgi:hypothetical protein
MISSEVETVKCHDCKLQISILIQVFPVNDIAINHGNMLRFQTKFEVHAASHLSDILAFGDISSITILMS